jgi:hypothetical protein
MKKEVAFVTLIVLSALSAPRAETIEVPLPNLSGYYGLNLTRVDTIRVSSMVDGIISASIRWDVCLAAGLGQDGGPLRSPTEMFPWPVEMSAKRRASRSNAGS